MVVQLPTKSKVNQAQGIGFSIFRGFAIVSIITLLGVIFLLSLVMEFFRNVAG
jgi:hypothetical protein